MNSRSASIVGDQEAAGSSSFAWCNRQWLSSQALTRRSSVRPKQAVFNHNLLWLPESNGYPLYGIQPSTPELWQEDIPPIQLTIAHVLRCTRVEGPTTNTADAVGREHHDRGFACWPACGSQKLPRISGILSLCASESDPRRFGIPRLPQTGVLL